MSASNGRVALITQKRISINGLVRADLGTNFREYTDKIQTKPALPQDVGVFLERKGWQIWRLG